MMKLTLGFLLLITSYLASAVDLQGIPTAYIGRCVIGSDAVEIKFSANLATVLACETNRESSEYVDIKEIQNSSLELFIGKDKYKLLNSDRALGSCEKLTDVFFQFIDELTEKRYNVTISLKGLKPKIVIFNSPCIGFAKL